MMQRRKLVILLSNTHANQHYCRENVASTSLHRHMQDVYGLSVSYMQCGRLWERCRVQGIMVLRNVYHAVFTACHKL